MRPVPQLALDFISGAEDDKLTAYPDARGVWTIGRGHTGPEVVHGLTITEAQSRSYLVMDVTLAARRLATVVKDAAIQALTVHEYAALLSFVFNLGEKPEWGIWKDLNGGNLADVPNQMMLFDKAKVNGVATVVPGLIHRRMAEVALWKAPDVTAAVAIVQNAPHAAPPSSYTRDAATPPTEVSAKPQLKSKTFVTSCLTACAAAAAPFAGQVQGVLKTVNDTITPYAGQSTVLQHIQGELVVDLAGLATLTAVFAYFKNRAPGQ
jgi:lysozyme